MSYFPCRNCGKMIGVIGQTVYTCDCRLEPSDSTKPTVWLDPPDVAKGPEPANDPGPYEEWNEEHTKKEGGK